MARQIQLRDGQVVADCRIGRSIPMSSTQPRPPRSRLRPGDLLPVGTVGRRARRLRAGLSALGVAIGIAAIVGRGITRSSQAELLAQIDRLGTDLLTVANGRSIQGQEDPAAHPRRRHARPDRRGPPGRPDRPA